MCLDECLPGGANCPAADNCTVVSSWTGTRGTLCERAGTVPLHEACDNAERRCAPARLRGLAHAAEWLAVESRAKTLLLLPERWSGRRELDHVTYGAITLTRDEITPPPAENTDIPPSVRVHEEAFRDQDAPLHVVVGPITGKPHPASEVEQLVHREIMADPDLRGLFEYNQRLLSFGEKAFIVDLLWREGRLIVELDGPEHHGHMAYVRDRDRDYRFLMHGYQTLRIANAEVYTDIDRVLDKIRNVVRKVEAPLKGKKKP